MFTKPIDEITFEDVKSFCQVSAESVRVEYKKEIRHIPKIVSSFSNTYVLPSYRIEHHKF